MSSSRGLVKPPGNKQLPIKNWHSRLKKAVTSFHLRPAGVKRRDAAGWSEAGAQRPRMRQYWASDRSKPAGGRGRWRIPNNRLHM